MKKILSILFVAVLAFGMASCKSKEEKAVDEFVTICDQMAEAAEDNDAAKVLKLSGEMMELGKKYGEMEDKGELKLTEEQEKRIQEAAIKAQRAMMQMDIDL